MIHILFYDISYATKVYCRLFLHCHYRPCPSPVVLVDLLRISQRKLLLWGYYRFRYRSGTNALYNEGDGNAHLSSVEVQAVQAVEYIFQFSDFPVDGCPPIILETGILSGKWDEQRDQWETCQTGTPLNERHALLSYLD